MRYEKKSYLSKYLVMAGLFLVCLYFLVKYFNLTWVEVNGSQAKITINFLFPMNQKQFDSAIKLSSDRSDSQNFTYKVNWLSPQAAEIMLSENNEIQGLKIKLLIKNAPTKVNGFTKSEKVNIQFNAPIRMREEESKRLISSTESFVIHFNTPIRTKEISKFIACEVPFNIAPYKATPSSTKTTDATRFVLVPKVPLKNGKCYTLTVKSGLRADSGNILSQDIKMYLQVDQKPTILETYPAPGDKWIGLYPKITFTSKEPIIAAIAKINNEMIPATLVDDKHGYFLLKELLLPMTDYVLEIQTKAESGELSTVKEIPFSTTSTNDKRGWLEIKCGKEKCIRYYEGQKNVKTFVCGIGSEITPSQYGTYYLQGKAEVYENYSLQEGANYWMLISDDMGIHGFTRNSHWDVQENKLQDIGGKTTGKNILLSDDDAKWLYAKINSQTMVIIKD